MTYANGREAREGDRVVTPGGIVGTLVGDWLTHVQGTSGMRVDVSLCVHAEDAYELALERLANQPAVAPPVHMTSAIPTGNAGSTLERRSVDMRVEPQAEKQPQCVFTIGVERLTQPNPAG